MRSAEPSVRMGSCGVDEERLSAERVITGRRGSAGQLKWLFLASAVSAGTYHAAWFLPGASALVLIYAWGLMRVADCGSAAVSFRCGFLVGFLVFAPQLGWFWNIFGAVAICLWALLSFFTGFFSALFHMWQRRFGERYIGVVAAILWTGIEYFRSELYTLKFSWLSVGSLFFEGGNVIGKLRDP